MSGYSERAAAESAQGDSSIRLLTKPFSRSALLRAVHEILNPAQIPWVCRAGPANS
jgi:hypothetical protein